MMMLPPQRKPKLTLRQGHTALLNQSAIDMLTKAGETHLAIRRSPDGTITLQPCTLGDALAVVKINRYAETRHGSSRVFLGRVLGAMEDGRYDLVWDDENCMAVLKKTDQ